MDSRSAATTKLLRRRAALTLKSPFPVSSASPRPIPKESLLRCAGERVPNCACSSGSEHFVPAARLADPLPNKEVVRSVRHGNRKDPIAGTSWFQLSPLPDGAGLPASPALLGAAWSGLPVAFLPPATHPVARPSAAAALLTCQLLVVVGAGAEDRERAAEGCAPAKASATVVPSPCATSISSSTASAAGRLPRRGHPGGATRVRGRQGRAGPRPCRRCGRRRVGEDRKIGRLGLVKRLRTHRTLPALQVGLNVKARSRERE